MPPIWTVLEEPAQNLQVFIFTGHAEPYIPLSVVGLCFGGATWWSVGVFRAVTIPTTKETTLPSRTSPNDEREVPGPDGGPTS